MGLFTEKKTYTSRSGYDYGERVTATELNARGKAAIWLGVLAGGFGLFSNEGLGAFDTIIGHNPKERSAKAMNREVYAKYQAVLRQASPAQLYELRYTDHAQIMVGRQGEGDSGLTGLIDDSNDLILNPERIYSIGDGCLNDTAYDINGGKLHFNVRYYGLFSTVVASASGDTPTAAAQAIYSPGTHELTIKSGNTHSDNLNFGIEGTRLSPMDQTTKDVLTTYGCKPAPEYSFTTGGGDY